MNLLVARAKSGGGAIILSPSACWAAETSLPGVSRDLKDNTHGKLYTLSFNSAQIVKMHSQ